ncbi:hypothetical protein EYF80_035060 [Liparis tanakae]|uniref:Uncharacterized protein n=1 Tax=Liparis tanakae TaxID=230148 RepID=A0A4Z2GMD2_9TELE|nr:hypothetical protein EYF80_035060 [Liparis tanakae]
MSLGTTLRLPLGNRVEVMDVRRLGEEREARDREGGGGVPFCLLYQSNRVLRMDGRQYSARELILLINCTEDAGSTLTGAMTTGPFLSPRVPLTGGRGGFSPTGEAEESRGNTRSDWQVKWKACARGDKEAALMTTVLHVQSEGKREDMQQHPQTGRAIAPSEDGPTPRSRRA